MCSLKVHVCTCTMCVVTVVHDYMYMCGANVCVWKSLTHRSRFSRLGIQCSIFTLYCEVSKPMWLLIF